MDIRNSLDGLKSLLGVTQPTAPAAAPKPGTTSGTAAGANATASALTSDKATFSSAGSQVALTASDSDIRLEKVTSIQAALASGTYDVPPSAVASKMVDSMISARP